MRDGISYRPGMVGNFGQVRRQRSKERLVVMLIETLERVRVLPARAAMLDRAFERPERLRPLAILAAIPEEERVVLGPGQRHRGAGSGADAVGEWQSIGEVAAGLMAGGACNLAV